MESRSIDLGLFTPRQAAQYDSDEKIAEVFGPMSQDTGPDGAHYVAVSPFAAEGLVCANCAFYEGPRGCEIVAGDIDPAGICKRWIIPESLIVPVAAPQRSADTVIDNIVRCAPFELRAAADGGPGVMSGHFAVFNEWTRISSFYEGDFMERVAPGAFTGVFQSGQKPKVLFDHGGDPSVGNKVLGVPIRLEEDARGAAYDVALHDTTYVRDLLPGLRSGQYGASFRFRVAEDRWVQPIVATAANPDRLPERTITRIDPLYEFGPVTFPAYAGASAGVRSGTDQFYDRLLGDPAFVAKLTTRLGENVVGRMIADGRASDAPKPQTAPQSDGRGAPNGVHPSVLRARIEAIRLANTNPQKGV